MTLIELSLYLLLALGGAAYFSLQDEKKMEKFRVLGRTRVQDIID